MELLAIIIAAAALVVALVALFRGGILAGTPSVRSPTLAVNIPPVDVNCGGNFVGDCFVTATYPSPPPTARRQIEVTLSILVANKVIVDLGAKTLRFGDKDSDTQSAGFTGMLTDPCSRGTFQVMASVPAAGRLGGFGSPSNVVNVSGSGFKIDAGQPTPTSNLDFTLSLSIMCCLPGLPMGVLKVDVTQEQNVVIDRSTLPTFACIDGLPKTTIKGRKVQEDAPGIFLLFIRNDFGGPILCFIGNFQVE